MYGFDSRFVVTWAVVKTGLLSTVAERRPVVNPRWDSFGDVDDGVVMPVRLTS